MRFLVALGLLTVLVVSGCLGSAPPAPQATTEVPVITAVAPSPTPTSEVPVFVPKFHMHDYWNGRAEVVLFSGTIRLGEDLQKEVKNRGNTTIIGFKDFHPKSDGDDVGSADKTDTVYQGTKEIVVKVDWPSDTTSQIKGVTFSYKSAAGPTYSFIPNMQKGKEYTILVRKGMADMPHQLELSRWRFGLEAYDGTQDALPQRTYVAKGDVTVFMKILNGGERFIDPPHPYFFPHGPVRYAGEINQTLSTTVMTNASVQGQRAQVVVGSQLMGWKVGNRNIIPWETTLTRVWLYYNYTGKATALPHQLALRYADASGPDENTPKAAAEGSNWAYYDIPTTEAMTDSPYATSSDWAWGVYPIVNGQPDLGGDFEGTVHILVHAVKEGETASRGMGN